MKKYKPEGYPTVSLYCMVGDILTSIEFLSNVFKGNLREIIKDPEGNPVHAEVEIEDSVVMLGQAPSESEKTQGMAYVFVADVDAVYKLALDHGAESVQLLTDQYYGCREGGFKDPDGTTWWVAQMLEELSEEEIESRME